MRFPHLIGLCLASSAFGCMAASAPPPLGPTSDPTAVATTKDAPPLDPAGNKKPDLQPEKPLEAKEEKKEDEKADKYGLGSHPDGTFGGLGLSGTGTGGGGTGEGIGLGNLGTLGKGAGTGTGQGYGSGAGGTAGKKGHVGAATATTTGTGLPTEVIQRIVKANLTHIQSCYEKAMTKDAALAGKVAVKFVIDAQGAVTSASASDTNITDADMVSCVVGAVKAMAFPAPDGGGPMVVTYPFNFSSGDN